MFGYWTAFMIGFLCGVILAAILSGNSNGEL